MNGRDFQVINVVHEADGIFANGTISTLDGTPKVMWTFTQDGAEFEVSVDLEDEEFQELWDVLNDPVFVRNRVHSPDAELDFRKNYLVGVMFNFEGEAGRITHLIPAGERDATWTDWLKRVEQTRKPR